MAAHLARALLTPRRHSLFANLGFVEVKRECTHISALKPLLLVVEILTKAQTSS